MIYRIFWESRSGGRSCVEVDDAVGLVEEIERITTMCEVNGWVTVITIEMEKN